MDENLVGKTFNRLTILQKPYRVQGRLYVKCVCTCGKETSTRLYQILNGHTKSCGCFKLEIASLQGKNFGKHSAINYAGMRINNWLIIEPTNLRDHCGTVIWVCQCIKCKKLYNRVPSRLKRLDLQQCKNCALKYSTKTTVSRCASLLLDKIESYLQCSIEREYQIEDRFFDGCIPNLNILIESDSIHWHSSKEAKLRDSLKDELAIKYGYDLIRVKNSNLNTVNSAFEQFKQCYVQK